MDINNEIEVWIPNLIGKPYKIIDTFNDLEYDFNCVSYTLGIYDYWMWTNENKWISSIPRNLKNKSFKLLYEYYGYEECDSDIYEDGFEKIAFYSLNGNPKHAAKQYYDKWRSKINIVIIEHELDWITGYDNFGYGDVAFIMKRKNSVNESLLDELKGPTEEEVWNVLKDFILSPNELLIKSVKIGFLNGVKKALKDGADIHTDNDIVLIYAVEYGLLDIVKYLVEQGANIHMLKDAPLRWSAKDGHLGMIKYLVEHGADIHVLNDAPLRYAAQNGHLDVVKYLVEHYANIHVYNDSILISAVENCHLDVVKYLVENGADIHAVDDEPLKLASIYGHLDIVEYLEEQIKKEKLTEGLTDFLKGPTDDEVWNELKKLNGEDFYYKVKRIKLSSELQKKADIKIESYLKELKLNNMLIKSSEIGFLKGVKEAIEFGADIHYIDDYALRYAALGGHLDVVKYLVEQGADIHANNDFPLRSATVHNHFEIVKYLVEQGADIHINNDEALIYASKNKRLDVVKYLKEQIKKEKITEGLNDFLTGPSKEDLMNNIINSDDHFKMLLKLIGLDFKEGIDYILKNNPNDTKIQGLWGWYNGYLKKWFTKMMSSLIVVSGDNFFKTDFIYDKTYTHINRVEKIFYSKDDIFFINKNTNDIYLIIYNDDDFYNYNYNIINNIISNDSRLNLTDCEILLKGLTKFYFNVTPSTVILSSLEHIKYNN